MSVVKLTKGCDSWSSSAALSKRIFSLGGFCQTLLLEDKGGGHLSLSFLKFVYSVKIQSQLEKPDLTFDSLFSITVGPLKLIMHREFSGQNPGSYI